MAADMIMGQIGIIMGGIIVLFLVCGFIIYAFSYNFKCPRKSYRQAIVKARKQLYPEPFFRSYSLSVPAPSQSEDAKKIYWPKRTTKWKCGNTWTRAVKR